jgi:hypothetical protein
MDILAITTSSTEDTQCLETNPIEVDILVITISYMEQCLEMENSIPRDFLFLVTF